MDRDNHVSLLSQGTHVQELFQTVSDSVVSLAQIQIKLDLNEWTTAQNNAMMKQDIVEVYLKDYKRQMDSYEQDIVKRGYQVPTRDSSASGLTIIPERSPVASTTGSVAGSIR